MATKDMTDTEREVGVKKGLDIYRKIGMSLGGLVGAMTVLGILGAVFHDRDTFPYFCGGFAVAVTATVSALFCMGIYKKGTGNLDTIEKKGELANLIMVHHGFCILPLLGGMGGGGLAGVGLSYFGENGTINNILIIVILLGSLVCIGLGVYVMYIYGEYCKYFGLVYEPGYRGRMMLVNIYNRPPQLSQTNGYPSGDARMDDLERQNRILQLQLQQQQHQQQINQQQQQFGVGASPMY